MLEEIGTPYELIRVNVRAGEQGTSAFRRINPMTKLPALDGAGVRVAESADLLLAGTPQIAFMAKLLEPKGALGDYVERAVSREGHARAVAVEQREIAALK